MKSIIKTAALKYLKVPQKEYSKVKHIVYTKLTTQNYMLNPMFTNHEVNLLYALRSRATECKTNCISRSMYTPIYCVYYATQNMKTKNTS